MSAPTLRAVAETPYELRGTGSPEGVVAAPPGTYYTDQLGTAGMWRWLKIAGTGTTGWTIVFGDTGWRALVRWAQGQVTFGTMPAGLEPGHSIYEGGIFMRRKLDRVEMSIVAARMTADAVEFTSPVGFRGSTTGMPYPVVPLIARAGAAASAIVAASVEVGVSVVRIRSIRDSYLPAQTTLYGAEASWSTDAPPPTVLPGAPK
ncbi:hypothetical protein GCM10011490_24370 [Pseudoclavibacter endophyticus]|uniref:Uncharacterized protein n=1 Tax=Pseudoclavibacter endophyticus TaxID=1778590 RepID=A0A6H9WB53_9MICO|nr:hypothetical protein [Pseudoclavibacter endophyticus]KAB1647780.1 hypothetical protein F8O04_12190 [Pseudoclavibacter endophyticus]GGA72713.1 hypothetical protein GCM10011490_24370 [Pseudoclavibacter endophyticus]